MNPKLSRVGMTSVVLLTAVALLTFLGALASAGVAYFAADDPIGPTTLKELAGEREEVATALKARRGTAAAFAGGYAALLLSIVLVPYRRGEAWSWWAVLLGTVASSTIILLRFPTLGTTLGIGAGVIPLFVSSLALVMDLGRFKARTG